LKRSQVTHGYCIRNPIPRGQIEEILNRFNLTQVAKPFTRCLSCNGMVKSADRNDITGFVPERIQGRFASYSICNSCGKIYWEGSHYDKLKKLIEELGVRSR